MVELMNPTVIDVELVQTEKSHCRKLRILEKVCACLLNFT